MRLSKQDTDMFFKLMWSLQLYANKKHTIYPKVTTIEEYINCTQDQKKLVRDSIYEDTDLIDEFLQANPQGLSQDELDIVETWKQFVAGNFFVERLLKKYAIFIGDESVYAVQALYDSFQDILAYTSLPVYVKAVLLPFKGKITYDGLLSGYNVYFGGGVKSDLKEVYMIAKQNRRIIESLVPHGESPTAQRQTKPSKDWRPEVDELNSSMRKLRSRAGDPPIISPAFSLAKAGMELTHVAVHSPEDLDKLWRAMKKVERAVRRVETTLYRTES